MACSIADLPAYPRCCARPLIDLPDGVPDGAPPQLVCTVPELNVSMDTYRVGTMMEMIREIAYSLADVGLNTRIMVQPSMGEGIFKSLPLALSGVMSILKGMDWEEGLIGEHIRFGEVKRRDCSGGGRK